MQISPRASWTIRSLNLGALQPCKPLRPCEKQLSIGFEPKRLGSLASPASAFALKGGVGLRGFGLSRYAQSECQRRVNVSAHIKTYRNIFLSGNAKQRFTFGRVRAGNCVANNRPVLHTAGEDFPCNKKTAGSRNVGDRLLYLGSR